MEGAPGRRSPSPRASRWWTAVGCLSLLALGIRIAAVLVDPNKAAQGDSYYYAATARLMAQGIFGVSPAVYYLPGHPRVATAFYAPMFSAVLSLAPLVGAKSFLAMRLWCCAIGTAAVPLGALVGRQLVGRRVGLIVGLLVAVYPNLWMSDGLALSETLVPVLVLVVLLAAYRFWDRPSVVAIALLGVAIAAAALTHDELSLLTVFVLVPLAFVTRLSWRRRIGLAAAGLAAAALVVGPWVGWNLTRFSRPVFISDNLGFLLANADCSQTWSGPHVGYWSFQCALAAPHRHNVDESEMSADEQADGLSYIDHHLASLPRVTAQKVGRGLALYRPLQQVQLDHYIETRPLLWAYVGLGMYYGLVVLSIGGVVVLRRRAVAVFPLLAVCAVVVLAMMVGFGQTRYRTAAEVPLVLLASVALDAGLHRRRRLPPGGDEEASERSEWRV